MKDIIMPVIIIVIPISLLLSTAIWMIRKAELLCRVNNIGLAIIFSMAVFLIGCSNNVQKVRTIGVNITILSSDAKFGIIREPVYGDSILVENDKGEKIEIFCPEESFFALTHGTVEKGMTFEISKDIKKGEWAVINMLSTVTKKLERSNQTNPDVIDSNRKIEIQGATISVNMKTGLITRSLDSSHIFGSLGDTKFDGRLRKKINADSTKDGYYEYVDSKTNEAKNITFLACFDSTNNRKSNRFVVNRIFIDGEQIKFNVTSELLDGQIIQLEKAGQNP